MGTLTTYWNMNPFIRQLPPVFPKPLYLFWLNWSLFVRTGGVCFTCHTNRTFLCATYLFIGCLSPFIAPEARQHKHGLEEGKSILQKPLQHPIILFIPKAKDTKQEKRIILHPGTNAVNNSSVEWNADAWSRTVADNRSGKEILWWLQKCTEQQQTSDILRQFET